MDVGEDEEDGGEGESEGEESMASRRKSEEEVVHERKGYRDGHHWTREKELSPKLPMEGSRERD